MANPIQYATHAYVSAFIDELIRCGVRHACVCPGSRSTPLAMVLAANPSIRVWMHLDERSAAYFALGIAKAALEPVLLVCTSGTAAANFLPAIVEAYYARVALIVMTADRPPELRNVGAPQTIDQNGLYGSHVKHYVEVALPDSSPDLLRYARLTADRAFTEARTTPLGPVHLNFPFREPLVPLPPESAIQDVPRTDSKPYTQVKRGQRTLDLVEIRELVNDIASAKRGLIVCGTQRSADVALALIRLGEMLDFPILADVLSQLRTGHETPGTVITTYDAFLRDPAFVQQHAPDIVLRFGYVPTSKPLLQYLQKYSHVRQILIDSGGGWHDPTLSVSDILHAETNILCEALIDQLTGRELNTDSTWVTAWLAAEHCTRTAMDTQIAAFEEPFEGRVFTELAEVLPRGATIYVSSSMPVRDMDTFFPRITRSIRFLSNRGANGIDGVVSSALGTAALDEGPLVLVIGDLALYHDMNGLMAAKMHNLNATIVLINNNGGGIFSFLPQAAYPEHFELLYGTPHGLDFRKVAALYDTGYMLATDWQSFRSAVNASIQSGGLNIVEIQTDRERNVKQHRAIWQAVSAALSTTNSTSPTTSTA